MAICRHSAQSACTGISSISCGCSSFQSFTFGLCSDDDAPIFYFSVDVEHGGAGCGCHCAYRVCMGVQDKSPDGVSVGGSRCVCAHVTIAAQHPGCGLSV